MKVLLRSTETGLFFKDTGQWTASREEALNFKNSVRAIERVAVLGFANMEIILDFGAPALDLAIALDKPKARKAPKAGV